MTALAMQKKIGEPQNPYPVCCGWSISNVVQAGRRPSKKSSKQRPISWRVSCVHIAGRCKKSLAEAEICEWYRPTRGRRRRPFRSNLRLTEKCEDVGIGVQAYMDHLVNSTKGKRPQGRIGHRRVDSRRKFRASRTRATN